MAGEPVQRRLQFVLEHFGKRPTENVVLNYFSLANEVYTITVGDERFVVKNCFKNNTQALVENETALIRHLQKSGIPTPALVATKKGHDFLNYDGQYFVMNEFVEGYSPNWEDPLPASLATESIRALADFHRVMSDFELPHETGRLNSLDLSAARNWLEVNRQQAEQQRTERPSAEAILPIFDQLIALVDDVEADLKSLDVSLLKPMTIHGDLHCFNLIFNQEKSRYISILDFDFIRKDYRLFDILWLSRSLIWHFSYVELFGERPPHDKMPPLEKLQQATNHAFEKLIKTYRKYHQISDEELRLLPLFIKLLPLYTVRFFSLENSEDECQRHIQWFSNQLEQLSLNIQLTRDAVNTALDKIS